MLEAGKKFRHLVQFTSGQPTSDLTYTLYNQDGGVVTSGSASIPLGQVSYTIDIPAASNSLSKPLLERMTLEWEYDTASEAMSDSLTYLIHTPIPFPASREGVRDMLGVDREELPDEDISIFEAYLDFQDMVGETVDLSLYAVGDLSSYKLTKAIEAVAALKVFATIQIRLPKKYDSGTSSYERWTNIDWAAMEARLTSTIAAALVIIDPEYEIVPTIDIFVLSDRGPDAITGV